MNMVLLSTHNLEKMEEVMTLAESVKNKPMTRKIDTYEYQSSRLY